MNYLEEYQALRDSLPRAALAQVQHVNSDYCNYIDKCKDCYLISDALQNEMCMYSRDLFYNLYCVDCNRVHNSEFCYECVDCRNCYNCDFCQDCEQCADSKFCYECKGCRDCFMCVNLRHQRFCIFNKPCSESVYREKKAELTALKIDILQKALFEFEARFPRKAVHGYNNENSVGDYISNTQNNFYCFDSKESRDCSYCYEILKCEDCVDVSIGEFSKWNYDCISSYKLHNSNFCYNCWESTDLIYCDQCYRCEHCLFCAYLNHKKFCIFNKQYSRETYFLEMNKIIAALKQDSVYGQWPCSTYPALDSLAFD